MLRVEHLHGVTFTYDRWSQTGTTQEVLLLQNTEGHTIRFGDVNALINTLIMLQGTHHHHHNP